MFPTSEIIRPPTGHRQETIPKPTKRRRDLDDVCSGCPFDIIGCTLKESIDPEKCPNRIHPGDIEPN